MTPTRIAATTGIRTGTSQSVVERVATGTEPVTAWSAEAVGVTVTVTRCRPRATTPGRRTSPVVAWPGSRSSIGSPRTVRSARPKGPVTVTATAPLNRRLPVLRTV